MANASSGMAVADDCKLLFQELKKKKAFRYIIYKIDGQKVVIDRTGVPASSYDEFTSHLPEADCRYAVFDYDFTTADNCQKSKIFFIAWSPDISPVKSKMTYASSKDRFRRELDGVHFELQATDPTEMDMDVIKERCAR
eukprot:TRINITY_DN3849_c0_g1_i1.p2 TRINITY_DN3849_c0_g1~~TRINITY_DN3849_c0_g1_i1.p2  ORF type:complete len:139 (+),score=24.21 TRINITY_DN3849_c0_g1_i1:115-531(+)